MSPSRWRRAERCNGRANDVVTVPPSTHARTRSHNSPKPCDGVSGVGTSATSPVNPPESASLIGRLGSSAFRLSTSSVSMSLTGSCFSTESAPRPFHHGIRRQGGTIFRSALPSDGMVQANSRSHLIHRPARDIIPPLGGARMFPLSDLVLRGFHAAAVACSRVQQNPTPSTRASATMAFFIPQRDILPVRSISPD